MVTFFLMQSVMDGSGHAGGGMSQYAYKLYQRTGVSQVPAVGQRSQYEPWYCSCGRHWSLVTSSVMAS